MSHSRMLWTLALALTALASSSSFAQDATGVKWRNDYLAARKESAAKNLPIIIDFVRPACLPCERMDQLTFRDGRIVAVLNEKFIPLRVNGLEEANLAAALNIDRFPTIVLAGPDGRGVKTFVGFQEADALMENLQRMMASLAPPEMLQRDYQNALKWEANGEFARAIVALRGIQDDGRGASLQKDAADLLKKIERRAEERFAAARNFQDRGQFTEALEVFSDIVRVYPGLQASKDAADQLTRIAQSNAGAQLAQRTKRARELLTQAHEFYKSKDYVPCLDRCEIVLSTYGDLPEGQQAFTLAAEIKNNPEWLKAAAEVMTDRLGGMWLALADSHLKRGETQRAQHYLQRVVQAFPGSRMAESAQVRLTQLRGTNPGGVNIESARP